MASHLELSFLALVVLLATSSVVDASSFALRDSNSTVTSSLVAWWKLDEKIGYLVADSSGKKATGLVKVTGFDNTYGTAGVVFDGFTYIYFGTTPSLSGETDFSVQAWVKIPFGIKEELCIIQQRGPGFNGEFWLWINDGVLWFVVYNQEYQFNIKGTVAINDGEWHHVAAVREGYVGSIYVDSKLDNSVIGSKVIGLVPDLRVYIGYDSRDDKRYFKGSIKDVQIFTAPVKPVGFKPKASTV